MNNLNAGNSSKTTVENKERTMKKTYADVIKEAKQIGMSLSKWKLGRYKQLGIIKSTGEAIQDIVVAKFLMNIGLTLAQVSKVMRKHHRSNDIEQKYKDFLRDNANVGFDAAGLVYEYGLNQEFKKLILK
jgi:uncharacterized protein (UPF0335 family)